MQMMVLMDPYGSLWILMDSYGFPLNLWQNMAPMISPYGIIPMGPCDVCDVMASPCLTMPSDDVHLSIPGLRLRSRKISEDSRTWKQDETGNRYLNCFWIVLSPQVETGFAWPLRIHTQVDTPSQRDPRWVPAGIKSIQTLIQAHHAVFMSISISIYLEIWSLYDFYDSLWFSMHICPRLNMHFPRSKQHLLCKVLPQPQQSRSAFGHSPNNCQHHAGRIRWSLRSTAWPAEQ